MELLKYTDILEAKDVLGLPEHASMDDIKARYRTLITRWHPDTCQEDRAQCEEMTKKLNAAYTIIRMYCEQYRYSFARADIENYMSPEEWWRDKFGNDPLWGKGRP